MTLLEVMIEKVTNNIYWNTGMQHNLVLKGGTVIRSSLSLLHANGQNIKEEIKESEYDF